MVPALRQFIEKHIDVIEQRKWTKLYELAHEEVPFQVGNLSYNLIKAGINPLEELDYVLPYMFSDANDLKDIELPANIKQVQQKSFVKCYQLKKIVIPKSVMFIDETAFDACYELEDIQYLGTAEEFLQAVEKPATAFWDCATGTVQCADKDVHVGFNTDTTGKDFL